MGAHHELLELQNKEGGPPILLKAVARTKFGEYRSEFRSALQSYENCECAGAIGVMDSFKDYVNIYCLQERYEGVPLLEAALIVGGFTEAQVAHIAKQILVFL